MGVYVNLKCRGCGESLTGGYVRTYAGIGEPLIDCPSCRTVNSHVDRVTEWQLMGGFRRFWLLLTLGWSTLFFYGIGGTVLATFLLLKEAIRSEEAVFAIIAAALAIGLLRLMLYFRKGIRLSNERMCNPAYREKLRRHGLASG
ncbi:hypothetical protein [uncultured Sphingomonas sp.]|uniref:hypothetical protein n=1 Tax=uncultured Sphingomonas sp. TaxID=158754 RepID=UPI00259135CB|nr:hypothetical protein [uncultured Sphingomonas sp.]